MKYPKLWDGPNPVGEAKARHLETIDVPFLRASGPGFSTHKRGEFSEVYGTKPNEEKVEDGWYSFSAPVAGVVTVVGTGSPQNNFRRRGLFASAFASASLTPSGGGWGYLREVVSLNTPSPDYTRVKQSRSSSGRSGTELFAYNYLSTTVEGHMGFAGIFGDSAAYEATYDGAYGVLEFGADKKTDTDGVVRQTGTVRRFYESSPGVWSESLFPSPIAADTESYGQAFGCVLKPGTVLMSMVKIGEVMPKLYITSNYGASWTACPPMPDIYPGQGDSWAPFKTRAVLEIDNPLKTKQEIEDLFVLQFTVQFKTYGTYITFQPIAADRVLLETQYYESDTTIHRTIRGALSVINPYTGELKWQTSHVLGHDSDPLPVYDARPTGFGAWIYFLYDANTESFLEEFVISGFGSTATPTTLPVGFASFQAPFYHRRETNENNLNPPNLYFMASDGATSYLALTKDYFSTAKITAKVGDYISGPDDFSNVVWVGTRASRAPIDPTFPWRVDTRFPTPDWWVNVSSYGG